MNVYFEGGFYSSKKYQKPLKRLPFQTIFQWKGFTWHLLAPYVCKYGLVLDFAKQIPAEALLAFENKWGTEIERYEKMMAELTAHTTMPEPDLRMTFENPMETELWADAWVNGREIESMTGCGCAYRPPQLQTKKKRADASGEAGEAAAGPFEADESDLEAADSPEAVGTDLEALALLEHYQLSKDCGWYFYRMRLKWSFKRIPQHLKLRLLLKPDRKNLPCTLVSQTNPGVESGLSLFFETETGEEGREICFKHPLDGTVHTLWLKAVTQEELSEEQVLLFGNEYLFPRQFQCLNYHLASEDEGHFQIRDMEQGDAPIAKGQEDGPAAVTVFLAGGVRRRNKTETKEQVGECLQTTSRLCFRPVERTKWEIDAIVISGEEKELNLDLEAEG